MSIPIGDPLTCDPAQPVFVQFTCGFGHQMGYAVNFQDNTPPGNGTTAQLVLFPGTPGVPVPASHSMDISTLANKGDYLVLRVIIVSLHPGNRSGPWSFTGRLWQNGGASLNFGLNGNFKGMGNGPGGADDVVRDYLMHVVLQ